MRNISGTAILLGGLLLASCTAGDSVPESLAITDEPSTTTTHPVDPNAALCGDDYSAAGQLTADEKVVTVAVDVGSAIGTQSLDTVSQTADLVACLQSTLEGGSEQHCGFYEDEEDQTIFIEATMTGVEYSGRLIGLDGAQKSELSGIFYNECSDEISYNDGSGISLGPTLFEALQQESTVDGESTVFLVSDLVAWELLQNDPAPFSQEQCADLAFLDDFQTFFTATGADKYWSDMDAISRALGDESIVESITQAGQDAAGASARFDDDTFLKTKLVDLIVAGGVGWGLVADTDGGQGFSEEVIAGVRSQTAGNLLTFDAGFANQILTVEQLQIARGNRC